MSGLSTHRLPCYTFIAAIALLALAPLPITLASPPELDWAEPHTLAVGDAQRGPWRMNDSEFHYVDDPSAAFFEDGLLGVVWTDQAAQDLRFQRFGPDGEPEFEDPVNVSGSPDTFSWLPRVRIDGDHVYVLWQEIVFSGGSHGGEAFFARSTDAGKTFSEPINLSETTDGVGKGRLTSDAWDNGSLDLAVAPDGTVHATWTAYEGGLYYTRSEDGGKTFSDPRHLAGDAERPARGPSLAVGEEAVALAWGVGEDTAADIHLSRSADAGETWGDPSRIHPGDDHADAPSLAMDSEGRLHLAFAESPDTRLWLGQWRPGSYQIRYTQASPGTTDFAAPLTVADSTDTIESKSAPYLAVDEADRLYLIWERFSNTGDQSVSLGYATAPEPEADFSEPSLLPGSAEPDLGFNGSLQGLFGDKLAVAPKGGVSVVNSTYLEGEASRIWLHRGARVQ
ncbi:sialidase family protein [Halorhodospira halochloris]|uniref:sialidase family protein n=1 Tax=Halorhodospira halochloris TaxID=1052 RepID=UPI001EE7C229|nr:sialidase family protein [Halorhodospira halochloris]MCG5549539.1 glycoside hydrolase [Halorhodospira halochloris]